jgi:acyl-CoA reductase-like NAD-dependent aldehyde dehydrogenase
MTPAMLVVSNPFNQQTVCELPFDRGSALSNKIVLARKAFELWSRLSLDERIVLIQEGLNDFKTHAEEIALDITLQMGKPITQARQEIKTFFQRAEYMISIAGETLAPSVLPPNKPGAHLRIDHLPLGVIYNLVPWSYPLLTAVNVVIPALLAGNSQRSLCLDTIQTNVLYIRLNREIENERGADTIPGR